MPVSDISSNRNHHLSSLTDNKISKHKGKFWRSKSFGQDTLVKSYTQEDVEELKFFKVSKKSRWIGEVIRQTSSCVEKENTSENNNNSNTKNFNAVKKSQGQKRKTEAFRDRAVKSKKIKLVDVAEKDTMYEYRSSSIKTDSDYIAKNEEDEENMINAFYQQRYLGGSNNSIATLCNIGNSCYLNSVIYTLRFAPYFLHKLHHLCDDMHYVYQKIGQNKLKSSSLGRNVSGLQVCFEKYQVAQLKIYQRCNQKGASYL